MKAGFAKQKITPPVGSRMLGLLYRDLKQPCQEVHDDLFVRAMFIEHQGEKTLVLNYDLLFWSKADGDRIQGFLGRHLDLLPRQILINFTHTHFGPALGTWAYIHQNGWVDSIYFDRVEQATLKAAKQAQSQMRTVSVWVGKDQTDVPVSRRLKDEQGVVHFAPTFDEDIFGDLPICLLKDEQQRPVALLCSASCHPTSWVGWSISAEYPGVIMQEVGKHIGADVVMFLQGCAGDTKARMIIEPTKGKTFRPGTWEDVQTCGRLMAERIIHALDHTMTQTSPRLQSTLSELDFPLEKAPERETFQAVAEKFADQTPADRRYLWAKDMLAKLDHGLQLDTHTKVLVHTLSLGDDMRIVALNGEPVADFGHWITQAFDHGVTFALGYSHDQGMYLPSERMLDEGGYEVDCFDEYGYPAKLAPGYETTFKNHLKQLAKQGW